MSPAHPGVEVVGAAQSGGDADNVSLREGANPILRYCLPAGAAPATGWVGVFPVRTPLSKKTQENANSIGFWLKTPGGGPGGPKCGETEA